MMLYDKRDTRIYEISERHRCPAGPWGLTPRWLQWFGRPPVRRPLYAWPQIGGGFDGWEYQ